MTTQHIGAAGELLVQYRLLKHEIDSARLTTDSGLDLVAYTPARGALTIQVKTVAKPGRAGGRGPLAVGWSFNPGCGADLMAFVDLSTDRVWVMDTTVAAEIAQQKRPSNYRLYWYTVEIVKRADGSPLTSPDMQRFLLENQLDEFLAEEPAALAGDVYPVTPVELARELGHLPEGRPGKRVRDYLRSRYPDREKYQRWSLDQDQADDVRAYFRLNP